MQNFDEKASTSPILVNPRKQVKSNEKKLLAKRRATVKKSDQLTDEQPTSYDDVRVGSFPGVWTLGTSS